jgi:hypothetical protein
MQLHVKSQGGQSPRVVVTGDRASLLKFADQIREGVAKVDEGPIKHDGLSVIGEPCDWIQVQVVKSMSSVVRDHQFKTRGILSLVGLFYLSLPVAAYLIFRGVRSFF